MSGGVDSSVASSLLKERYEVIGLHLNLGCALNTEGNARSIAAKLNIPFYSLDIKREFENRVINYFVREYSKGRTPNPCIVCNREIKFATLLKKVKELKADYMATGHYAQVTYNEEEKRYLLRKGKDRKKDQSYVLCGLKQKHLKPALFPLANLTREEIRVKAKGLGIHNEPSSQEVCFAPDAGYHEFLKTRMTMDKGCELSGSKKGLIVNKKGKILGKHGGIVFYTIGQRRGLGVATGKPLYVIAIDNHKDIIVVGSEKELLTDELVAKDMNWIAIDNLKRPMRLTAKIRYQHKEAEAIVTPLSKNRVRVKFKKLQRAITPGQAVVFYRKDVVLGGGWIS